MENLDNVTETKKRAKAEANVTLPEPKIRVFLPLVQGLTNDASARIDQNEVVTINGKNFNIKRGEYVDVSEAVYLQLRNRFTGI